MRAAAWMHRGRWSAVVVAGSVAVISTLATGVAGTLTAGTPTRVLDSPRKGTSTECDNTIAKSSNAGSVNYPGAEVEPYVAVDPTNAKHLVASFQQDRWNDGGSNTDINAYSNDGGGTWQLATTQPAFTVCAGAARGSSGGFDRATDPWVSFSSDGKIVYSYRALAHSQHVANTLAALHKLLGK